MGVYSRERGVRWSVLQLSELIPGRILPSIFTRLAVAEIVGTAGSEDPTTSFVAEEDIEPLEQFLSSKEKTPEWPAQAEGMCVVKSLYTKQPACALALTQAFVRMAVERAKRIYAFYRKSEELGTDVLKPSQAVVDQYRNPIESGGIYYVNKGAPIASLRLCDIDDDTKRQENAVALTCNKQVRVEGPAVTLSVADQWLPYSFTLNFYIALLM